MSIGTDVARIKGNITAALAAIADKGVDVPDGRTSDALAGLIASIEAGGGCGGSGIVYASGTLVFSSVTTCYGYIITHDLGVTPQIFILSIKYFTSPTNYSLQNFIAISEGIRNLGYSAQNFFYGYGNTGTGMYYRIGASNNQSITINESTITIPNVSDGVFVSGVQYSWHAIGGIEA